MHRHTIARFWLLLSILFCVGTTAASTPAACTGGYCTYLPLVSTPDLVAISNVTLRGTRSGNVVAVRGELNATTSTPVYSATLDIRVYNSDGVLLGTSVASKPVFDATLPGQPNPFDVGVYTGFEDVASYAEVHMSGFNRTHPRSFLPVTLNVTSYRFDGLYLNLSGTLTNEYGVPLEDIHGLAWTERGDRRYSRPLISRLAPYETAPFSITNYLDCCRPGDIIPYKIAAQGVVP